MNFCHPRVVRKYFLWFLLAERPAPWPNAKSQAAESCASMCCPAYAWKDPTGRIVAADADRDTERRHECLTDLGLHGSV
jgi:hypothetical protein